MIGKKALTIIVAGSPCTGKSAVAEAIKTHLKLLGLDVEIEDDPQDRPRGLAELGKIFRHLDASVTIKTVQTMRKREIPE